MPSFLVVVLVERANYFERDDGERPLFGVMKTFPSTQKQLHRSTVGSARRRGRGRGRGRPEDGPQADVKRFSVRCDGRERDVFLLLLRGGSVLKSSLHLSSRLLSTIETKEGVE